MRLGQSKKSGTHIKKDSTDFPPQPMLAMATYLTWGENAKPHIAGFQSHATLKHQSKQITVDSAEKIKSAISI